MGGWAVGQGRLAGEVVEMAGGVVTGLRYRFRAAPGVAPIVVVCQGFWVMCACGCGTEFVVTRAGMGRPSGGWGVGWLEWEDRQTGLWPSAGRLVEEEGAA